MKLIKFPEQNITIAANQPEYLPLPGHVNQRDPSGTVTCCWKLEWKDRIKVLFTGIIWHQILTFRQPLQPQLLSTNKPEMKNENSNGH